MSRPAWQTMTARRASALTLSRTEGDLTTAALPLVLVIDDGESFRDLVTLGLVANGFGVAGASDGVAGLTQLATWRPVAILTDTQMPCIDGLAFRLRARSMPAFDNTPIVVLSGGRPSSEQMGAAAPLRGVTARGRSTAMKTLATLLRGGCGPGTDNVQGGAGPDGTHDVGTSTAHLAGTGSPDPLP
jgi:CheY-like chemotaxis protein